LIAEVIRANTARLTATLHGRSVALDFEHSAALIATFAGVAGQAGKAALYERVMPVLRRWYVPAELGGAVFAHGVGGGHVRLSVQRCAVLNVE
jgi:hypothetical protein